MGDTFLRLSDITAYQRAYALSNYVWDRVVKWEYFARKTVGGQFVESVDSVSANIAEGFGRYFKKDKIKFYRYSFASRTEALDWNQKALYRKLLDRSEYDHIFSELMALQKDIRQLINYTDAKLKK